MSKRILSLVLALVMVLGTMGSLVFAEGTGNEKVDELIELGLVQGYGDGTYGLDKTITRAEVATMLVRALDAENEAKAMANIPSIFTDMSPLHWANGYVNYAVGKGIISGYPDKTFKPSNEITYAEVAKMLVEVLGGLTDAEKASAVWPTTWLAKAAQLGVFDGVSIADYSAKAVREKVFEMVYNVYFTKEVGNNTIVKAIVLENYRVETLEKDEVVVELISILQRAKFAEESRAEKGDQLKLVIPAKLGDVEDLLGKVVDITLDKNGNVLAIKLDNTYKYEIGTLSFSGNRVTVNGTKYTVELPERYRTSDERIFRTYIDNESYSYEDVKEKIEDDDLPSTAELARVTVKNGKVLFIDAFTKFADIAPVAKDIDSKNRVEFYDDAAAGDTDVITVGSSVYVLKYVDGKLLAGSNKDIKANDVIHWVANEKGNPIIVVVRPYEDAAVEGEFVEAKTPTTVPSKYRVGADVYLKVEDKYYPGYIFEKDPRNMVYSYYAQEGEFDVLDEDYLDVLADFEEEDVVVLLDIFGNVQSLYTETEILASEYALIVDTWGTDFRLLLSDNTKAWFDTDRDTTLVGGSDTRELKVNAFKAGSLVRAYADEDNLLSKLVLMKSTDDNVAPHGDVFEGVTKVTSAAVELEDGFKFVNKNTIVFLNIDSGKEAAMSLANFIKNYDQADDLDGYVVVSSRDKGLAEVIVITKGASLKASAAGDTVYGKVSYVGSKFLELDNGNRYTASASLLEGLKKGDIVAVVLEKDSETKVKEIYDPFDADKLPKGYHLAGITFQGTNKGRLVDSEGNEYRIDDAVIFDSYKRGDKLTIVVNEYNNVLFLKKAEAKIAEPEPEPEQVTYINTTPGGVAIKDGKLVLSVSNSTPQVIDIEYKNDTRELAKLKDAKLYIPGKVEGTPVASVDVNPGETKRLGLDLSVIASSLGVGEYTVYFLLDGKLQDETLTVVVLDNDVTVKKVTVAGVEASESSGTYTVQLPFGINPADVVVKASDIELNSAKAKVVDLEKTDGTTDTWTFNVEAQDGSKTSTPYTIKLVETKIDGASSTATLVGKVVTVVVKDDTSTHNPVKGLKKDDFVFELAGEAVGIAEFVESNTEAGKYVITLDVEDGADLTNLVLKVGGVVITIS